MIKKIPVPYPMPPAIDEKVREKQMAIAIEQGFPMLKARVIGNETITIVGYGPSLEDTWKEIKPPLITMSGSLKFLLEKGLKPGPGWFHVDVDPRSHKLALLGLHPEVTYLMGSVCHPKAWEVLKGMKVFLWHAMSGDHTPEWIRDNHVDNMLVAAGSCIGLCAVHIGGVLGYRRFEIHGFDGSWRGDKRHAGIHTGMLQGKLEAINPSGRKFITSRLMANSNEEVKYMLKNFPIFCVFHGDGLMQDWVSTCGLWNAAVDGTSKAESIRHLAFRMVSKTEAMRLMQSGVPVL